MHKVLLAFAVATQIGYAARGEDKTCPPPTLSNTVLWFRNAAYEPDSKDVLEFEARKQPVEESRYCFQRVPEIVQVVMLSKGKVLHSSTLKVKRRDLTPPKGGSRYWMYGLSSKDAAALEIYRAKADLVRVWGRLPNGRYVKPILAVDSTEKGEKEKGEKQ